jgi:Cys-tRNA(Pro)/Cys-tRNA(Cys) deacylase
MDVMTDDRTSASGPSRAGGVDTPALRALAGSDLAFEVVRTAPPSSVEESAALQGIDPGRLLRTIVVRRGADDYVFVLVPGGRQIDWPRLRAHLSVSRLSLPDQEEARAATGYERGAITPFGSSGKWPVVADSSIEGLDRVAIGGGARGVNLHLRRSDLIAALGAETAGVTRPDDRSRWGSAARPSPRRATFTGLFGPDLFVRLSEEDREALAGEGGGLFEPMPGRPMKEYMLLPAAWRSDTGRIEEWVARSLAWARTLPPEKK